MTASVCADNGVYSHDLSSGDLSRGPGQVVFSSFPLVDGPLPLLSN
jgi:hypothetical protein